ncbi:MAG: 2-hydroxycarboxylate transporter family protein, partial [Clostridiales bacterium]|nr:2-hydroxycarboxylate transporter family protein [Clostridiales bacterium]
YADVKGAVSGTYLSFALAILALGNIVAILMAVVLDLIGKAFPSLAGNDKLLIDSSKELKTEEQEQIPLTMDDIAAAIFLTAGFFMPGQLFAQKILPSVFGVSIPNFAYMIIFAALANILNLIPENLRQAMAKCQQFCGTKLVWIQMAGMGIAAIDFSTMLSVLSVSNLIIVIMIVAGAVLGAAIFGRLVGFYPIESGVTAGLCMANMGGAGDLAVLGAANRMSLMAYAQIASRIGGAIILLIGSVAFSFL